MKLISRSWQTRALPDLLVLAFLFAGTTQFVRAQAEPPDTIFWDGFETGDLLIWERVQIPGGGSIEFPPGSLLPGTEVVVQPVATPSLPPDIEALGQAFDTSFDPPLLLPAILNLPLPQSEDPLDLWIVGVALDGTVVVYETEVGSASPYQALNGNEESEPTLATALIIQGSEAHDAVQVLTRIAPTSDRPRITDTEMPRRSRVREPVVATVAWEGEAAEVWFDWGDGFDTIQVVDNSTRNTSETYAYEQPSTPGRYVISFSVERESYQSLALESAWIWTGIAGDWNSTYGNITFEEPNGDMGRGTYYPGQNGVITGFFSGEGQILTGHWVENQSNVDCDSEKPDSEGNPSDNWGKLEFVFDEAFSTFCGLYSYCDLPPSYIWNGAVPGYSPDC